MFRSRRRHLAGAVLIVISLVGFAVPTIEAAAKPRPNLTLSPTVGPPTTTVLVTGSGFIKAETVALELDGSRLGSTTARGKAGNIDTSLRVPETAQPGGHEITARGTISDTVLVTSFLVRTDWTQFHLDAERTGWNPFENSLSPANVSAIIVYDRRALEGAVSGSPVTCDGSVFVGDEAGNVYGFEDPDELPWVFETRGAILGSLAAIPPAIPPGPCKIIAASTDGNLYALDGVSGRLLWSFDIGEPMAASPLIIGDPNQIGDPSIVIGDLEGCLHAFDALGNRVWMTDLDGPISAPTAGLQAPPEPELDGPLQLDPGERLFVGTERGTLYSLNPGDGSVAVATSLDGPIVSAPAVTRAFGPPKVYVGTTNGTLFGLFADDLSEIWSLPLGAPILGTPAIGNPHIIGDPNSVGNPNIFAPGSDGNVYAIDEVNDRPTPLWIASLGTRVATSPALANGVLYFGADDSRLHALDAATGRELLTSDEVTNSKSSPIVADGSVYAGTTHGELIAWARP